MPTPPSTHEWACASGGALTKAERAVVLRSIRRGLADSAVGVASLALRRRSSTFEFPVAPDSRLAKLAAEAAAEQSPAVAGHGFRTWVLGSLLAAHDGTAVDPELLYVVGLLHDFGMVTEVVGEDFTVRSGHRLIKVAEDAGSEPPVGVQLADAAVAHATPGLEIADNPLGFYVQWGAMADLAGLRGWDLPRGAFRAAYQRFPGHGVHREIPTLIRREARDVPNGRFALLKRNGMDRMVQLSPTRRYDR